MRQEPVPDNVRAATKADIPQLIELGILAYGQYASLLPGDGWEKMRSGIANAAMWEGLLDRADSFLYVDGDAIVGMAFLLPHGNAWDVYPDEWCYIRMVGVNPAWSGRGIARKLTQRCLDKALNAGETTIALHTSEVMVAARHIYESLGFRVDREIATRFGIRYWLFTLPLVSD